MTASFGQKLIAAREKRGLSIEDAAHETRITAQRLRYLESVNIAAFGSMTYARSFIRQYSDFLEVDATEILEELPAGGVLGGERDYRYLTESHGPWLRERATRSERITAPAASRLQSIKSPVPTAIAVFVLILAGTGMWGKHVAESKRTEDVPKALHVEDDTPVSLVTSGVTLPATAAKPKQVDFPVSAPKTKLID